MNRYVTRITAAVAFLGATTVAFADGATYEHPTAFNSTLSRAVVLADAQAAQRTGSTVVGEATVEKAAVAPSQVLRARVLAEAAEARRLGLTGTGEHTPVASAAQEQAIQVAGERAVVRVMASNAR